MGAKPNLFPINRIFCLIGALLLCLLLAGCDQEASDYGHEVLLRVGERELTVHEFNEAFEISKTAYAHNIRQQTEDLHDAQMRLLNQLTVEMLILERGKELDISITDDELERAVSDIKSDYPEGEFEATLIESAVSFDAWRNRLKTRLTIEKVIHSELKDRISISPEDISEYYKKNYQGRDFAADATQSSKNVNEAIVTQLRNEKKEQAYKAWIEELRTKYVIEISSEQWDKIAASSSIDDNEDDTGESKSD